MVDRQQNPSGYVWHVLSLMDSASNIWLFGQIVGDNTLIYDNTLLAKIHANVTK